MVCLKCGEFLENSEALERHTISHRLKAKYNCERCPEFFARKQQYAKHLETHDKYACEFCGNSFSSRRRLSAHHAKKICRKAEPEPPRQLSSSSHPDPNRREGAREVVAAASLPAASMPTASMPAASLSAQAPEKAYIKVKNKFRCRVCVYEHVKASKVERHARSHGDLRKFVCELCGAAFKALVALKDHREYLHRLVWYLLVHLL